MQAPDIGVHSMTCPPWSSGFSSTSEDLNKSHARFFPSYWICITISFNKKRFACNINPLHYFVEKMML